MFTILSPTINGFDGLFRNHPYSAKPNSTLDSIFFTELLNLALCDTPFFSCFPHSHIFHVIVSFQNI